MYLMYVSIVAATKDEPDAELAECRARQNGSGRGKLAYNGYSEECLDRLEPNGNIPHDKDEHYATALASVQLRPCARSSPSIVRRHECTGRPRRYGEWIVKYSDAELAECRARQNGSGRGKLAYNGYSEECLDRLEPNGNIPHDKDEHYVKYPDAELAECRARQNGSGRGKLAYNGYSEECLDRLEPNGNIPHDKDEHYEWSGSGENGEYRVRRQLSVSSDSKLLDEGAREDARVVLRPRRPPRPKSEAFLGPENSNRRTKRFSAFGGDSPFGKSEAYIKLEQLGEGSYATVFKGYSK
ncbi:unnamed protein product [Plutella xylostella]|uniref:(diamondback moth) hypothetical protein n=1 Tax=Plutella xylostella TaxID=51655 RepID=A0A8S4D2Z3_PLUXY|nr:unnamed protein product [Plutella xylostella]